MSRVVVFDFDGTLTNVIKVAPKIAKDVFENLGLDAPSEEEIEKYRELSIPQALKQLKIPTRKVPKIVGVARGCIHKYRAEIKPIRGIEKLLQDLTKSREVEAVYILTSNSKENVADFMKRHPKLDCADEVVAGLTFFNKGRKLGQLLKRHGHIATDVYMVGDELRDIEAGDKVGTHTVAVTWGLGGPKRLAAAKPDFIANTVSDLRKVLL